MRRKVRVCLLAAHSHWVWGLQGASSSCLTVNLNGGGLHSTVACESR